MFIDFDLNFHRTKGTFITLYNILFQFENVVELSVVNEQNPQSLTHETTKPKLKAHED
jgi:uncharacterized alpha-E superfamily protein